MDEKEKYQKYLCSPEWWEKRNAVMRRANGTCEKCGCSDARHVHHLTYARKYNELLTDLIAVCEACHEGIHNPKKETLAGGGLEDTFDAASETTYVIRNKDYWIANSSDVEYCGHNCKFLLEKFYKELSETTQGSGVERTLLVRIKDIGSHILLEKGARMSGKLRGGR